MYWASQWLLEAHVQGECNKMIVSLRAEASIGLNSMLQAKQLPTRISQLDTCLTNVDTYGFSHCYSGIFLPTGSTKLRIYSFCVFICEVIIYFMMLDNRDTLCCQHHFCGRPQQLAADANTNIDTDLRSLARDTGFRYFF